MKQSHLFTKTRKDAPKDEVAKNAELLIRAGYVHKEMAGVYSYLPLGLRTLKKIENIIREEMNAIGGVELSMTALQDKTPWEKTGRWDDAVVDNWFKTKLKNETEIGLAITHEEPLTVIMSENISSYRDLPVYVYQFQNKFRNETRAKSGIMRGREFLMKDLYSFSRDEKEHAVFYEKAKQAYITIFKRLGIGDITHVTFASGGIFSKYSEEFQTESEAGEDIIYVEVKDGKETGKSLNKEILGDTSDGGAGTAVLADLGVHRADLVEKKSIEVGNIFNLGTKFSEPLGLSYTDENGQSKLVVMGSYGIGPSRIMGTIVEVLSDENGIVWPESVAPFDVHIVALFDKAEKGEKKGKENAKDGPTGKKAEELYAKITAMKVGVNCRHIEALYDDRDLRPGEKFADSDLIGIPLRIIVSSKNLADGLFEIKYRKGGKSGEVKKVSEAELFKILENSVK